MSRLPFDPSKMAAARGAGGSTSSESVAALTVSQLGAMIDGVLKRGFPQMIEVEGEIGGFSSKNHWYFELKDGNAVVSCAMWQSTTGRVKFTPRTGQQVKVKGRVEFYAKGGKLTFIVDRMEPAGAGALEAKLRALVEECRALGWLDPERKRPLPAFPRRVAVITSKTGAALQDVINTVGRRCPSVGLLLVDVRVQGDSASAEVAAAIRRISAGAAELCVDAVLVTRGGGSMEDLWGFNDREVARAIVECSVPVAAAIGHETDTTLAELVADHRCSTPTQAAMLLTPDRADLNRQLESELRRLNSAMEQLIENGQRVCQAMHDRLTSRTTQRVLVAGSQLAKSFSRLERCSPRAVHARMTASVKDLKRLMVAAMNSRLVEIDLESLRSRANSALTGQLKSARFRVDALGRQLGAINPTAVLDRGYSITRDVSGRVIRSANDCEPGTRLQTLVAEGMIDSVVTGPDESSGAIPVRKKSPAQRDIKNEGGLFS